jgi:hypothetical protein
MEQLLIEHNPCILETAVKPMTVKEYMEKKAARKQKREARKPLKDRILLLMKDMAQAGIKFKRLDLRKLGTKRWSGYYGYLIQIVRREV